jgi:hypothetical protein
VAGYVRVGAFVDQNPQCLFAQGVVPEKGNINIQTKIAVLPSAFKTLALDAFTAHRGTDQR